jgi:hypothetical protein
MESLAVAKIRTDGGTQPRAMMDWVTVTEYADAMLQGATFPPVVVFFDGADYWLADGFHRVKAAEQAGWSEIDADVRRGTIRDAILYSVGANAAHGMRRTNEDKRQVVLTLLQDDEWAQWSNREIARRCVVDEGTVRRLRDEISADYPQIERKVERGGTTYTMDTSNIGRPAQPDGELVRGPVGNYHLLNNGIKRCDACDQLWAADLEYCPYCNVSPAARIYHAQQQEQAERQEAAPSPFADLHFSSSTVECYTPPGVVARVLEVLGEIDLDPCSNSHDDPNIPATNHYTRGDDGLGHDWHGRVYMNPPYGRELPTWVEKLCGEYDAGRVTEAIALVPSRTDTEWYRRLREYPRCFIFGRLRFVGQENTAPFPSMAVYMGDRLPDFIDAFQDIGDVYELNEQQASGIRLRAAVASRGSW